MSNQLTKLRCVVLIQHGLLVHCNCVSKFDLMAFLMPIINKEVAKLDKLQVWRLNVHILLLVIVLILDEKSVERTLSCLVRFRF